MDFLASDHNSSPTSSSPSIPSCKVAPVVDPEVQLGLKINPFQVPGDRIPPKENSLPSTHDALLDAPPYAIVHEFLPVVRCIENEISCRRRVVYDIYSVNILNLCRINNQRILNMCCLYLVDRRIIKRILKDSHPRPYIKTMMYSLV